MIQSVKHALTIVNVCLTSKVMEETWNVYKSRVRSHRRRQVCSLAYLRVLACEAHRPGMLPERPTLVLLKMQTRRNGTNSRRLSHNLAVMAELRQSTVRHTPDHREITATVCAYNTHSRYSSKELPSGNSPTMMPMGKLTTPEINTRIARYAVPRPPAVHFHPAILRQ